MPSSWTQAGDTTELIGTMGQWTHCNHVPRARCPTGGIVTMSHGTYCKHGPRVDQSTCTSAPNSENITKGKTKTPNVDKSLKEDNCREWVPGAQMLSSGILYVTEVAVHNLPHNPHNLPLRRAPDPQPKRSLLLGAQMGLN